MLTRSIAVSIEKRCDLTQSCGLRNKPELTVSTVTRSTMILDVKSFERQNKR